MRIFKFSLYLILSLSLALAQDFGRIDSQENKPLLEEKTEISVPLEEMKLHPLDKLIDPEVYTLGPGDEIGLSIQIDRNLTFPLTVTPTGDLFIPSVGVCNVAGITLASATEKVKSFINQNAFPQAKSHMVLLNPRVFKLQVTGAVNKPGMISISSVSRLSEIISLVEGFRPLANEFEIKIIKPNGSSINVNYVDFLIGADITANPTFLEGDQLIIPFGFVEKNGVMVRGAVERTGFDIIAPNEPLTQYMKRSIVFTEEAEPFTVNITRNKDIIQVDPTKFSSTYLKAGDIIDFGRERGISVTGFVQDPGGFAFFPGYTANDYIALAGGNAPEGNSNGAEVIHMDGSKEDAMNAVLRRGDVIYVPRTLKNFLFGNIGAIPIIVSLTSLMLTYLAATK
jgi:protein involved in polysaccharide export with SLBB domain